MEVYHLGSWDYAVIALTLIASLGIGIRFATEKTQSSGDFMLAGRNMAMLPVVLSVVATQLSTTVMLGSPAEIYRYGSQPMVYVFGLVLGMVLAVKMMVPIYFNLGIGSIYEYLEMRYGQYIRVTVSGLFLIQMILYMSIALKGPALALSATTDLSTETSIWVLGVVCIIYCSLGGLKAVIWADSLQAGLMSTFLLIMFFVGLNEAGGFAEIISKAKDGGRWTFFNMRFDLVTRHTFWNIVFTSMSYGLGAYGMSQLEIQRLLSVKDLKRAQTVLSCSIMPTIVIVSTCQFLGLILFAIFYGCDPVADKEHSGVYRHDQLVPYYMVTRLSHIAGLTGLCISGLFGASLSSISSAINSMATVTVVDFIKPYCSCRRLTDKRLLWTAKSLVVIYGSVVIGVTFAFANIGTLSQMATACVTMTQGPMIAIFLLGILTTRNNEKGSIIGLFLGSAFAGWIGFGSILSGYVYPPLLFSTENCSSLLNTTQGGLLGLPSNRSLNVLKGVTSNPSADKFFVHRISYVWISPLGFITAGIASYIISIITDWSRVEKRVIDPKLLSPVAKLWTSIPSQVDETEVELQSKMLPEKNTAAILKQQNSENDCKL